MYKTERSKTMASTTSFNQVLQTGFSFLRVSLIIMVIVGVIGGLGFSILEDGEYGTGAVLVGISVVTLLAGIIGLTQKLVSDAFLEGFAAAKSTESTADGTRMDVSQTLSSGFSVIGVFLITSAVTGALYLIGLSFMADDSSSSTTMGSLLFATGCAIWLAMLLGMLARVIAEGVAFGANSTGVYFEFVPESGGGDKPAKKASFMEDWSADYKRLVFSTSILAVGMFLPWFSVTDNFGYSGFDILLALGQYPTNEYGFAVGIPYFGESSLMFLDFLHGANLEPDFSLFYISWAIWSMMPFAMLSTFGYAWYGYSNDDNTAALKAGKIHLALFIMMITLFSVNAYVNPTKGFNQWIEGGEARYIFSGRIGLCVAGLAGLGLIPAVTDRIFTKGGDSQSSKAPKFEDLDKDGDGSISEEELKDSGLDSDTFEKMDKDGDGSISEEEFDDFEFDFDDYDEDDDQGPDFEAMTVAELKEICKERGISTSGKKSDILARLRGEEE